MSLSFIRQEIQRAIMAAFDGKADLYDLGESVPINEEHLTFCARATELVLKAIKRAETHRVAARRAERPSKPPPNDWRAERARDAKAAAGNGKPFKGGLMGRTAAEVVKEEEDKDG